MNDNISQETSNNHLPSQKVGTNGPKIKNRWLRVLLLAPIVPIVLGSSIWYYEHSGRYVSTENAYVKAGIVQISAKVSGTVDAIIVQDNQFVRSGELLFRLKKDRFIIALDESDADLASARISVKQLKSDYRLLSLELKEANERVKLNKLKYERQRTLNRKKIGPKASLEEAKYNFEAAKQFSAGILERRLIVLKNLQDNSNLNSSLHPSVRRAAAKRNQRKLDLTHTNIFAPNEGIIANMFLQKGEFVSAGRPVFSIVKQKFKWIEANLKETQLTHIKKGQEAQIIVDAYPNLTWYSKVESIGAATGSEFSILPPQNASGNWIKVVQRIPIRLKIKKKKSLPNLRPGMSVKVIIDTKQRRSVLKLALKAWASAKEHY